MPFFFTAQTIMPPAAATTTAGTIDPTALIMSLGFSVVGILIIVLGYFLRKQLEAILDAQKEHRDRQMDCRETLPARFADKAETQSAFHSLYARTDRHENTLTRHEAILYTKGMTTPPLDPQETRNDL